MADLSKLPPPPAGYAVAEDHSNLPPPPAGYTVSGGEKPGFGQRLYETTVGPVVQAFQDPGGTAKVMLGIDQWEKAADEWKKGNHSAAIMTFLQHVAQSPGEKMGHGIVDPIAGDVKEGNLKGAAGGVVGNVLSFAVPELAGRVLPKILPKVKIESKLNPVEQRTVAFADANDIPLSLSQRTGNPAARGLEGAMSHDLGGAGNAAEAKSATTDAIARTGEDLADQAHPASVTPEQAGNAATGALEADITNLHKQANVEYAEWNKIANHPVNERNVQTGVKAPPELEDLAREKTGRPYADLNPLQQSLISQTAKQLGIPDTPVPVIEKMALPIDMRPVKEALQPIYDRMKRAMPLTKARASDGLKAIENILNEGDWKPATIAEQDLGAIKDAARSDIPELRDTSQGLAARAVTELSQSIEQAAARAEVPGYGPLPPGSANPALEALRAGRESTAKKWQTADVLNSFGTTREPVQVFQQLTWGRDSGIERLREVQVRAPQEMPKIGRAYVQGLLDTATKSGDFTKTQSILNSWDQLGPETKKILFPDKALVSNLDDFFRLARRTAENPNPSGTAYVSAVQSHVATFVTGAGLMVANPAAGAAVMGAGGLRIISNAALTRLLFNPRIAKALTDGMKMPTSSPGAAAAMAAILKAAPLDARPYEPERPK